MIVRILFGQRDYEMCQVRPQSCVKPHKVSCLMMLLGVLSQGILQWMMWTQHLFRSMANGTYFLCEFKSILLCKFEDVEAPMVSCYSYYRSLLLNSTVNDVNSAFVSFHCQWNYFLYEFKSFLSVMEFKAQQCWSPYGIMLFVYIGVFECGNTG